MIVVRQRTDVIPKIRLWGSFEDGVAVLECFSRGGVLKLADIASIVGMTRSTTHRYTTILVALGYLEQDAKRRYRLSRRSADPGVAAIGALRLRMPLAKEGLIELRDELGYTVSMGVLDGLQVLYVYRLFGHRSGQYEIDQDLMSGAKVPVYCTGLGKVLLASLSKAQRREMLAQLHLVPHGPRSITTKKMLAAELNSITTQDVVVSDEEFIHGARSVAVLVGNPNSEHELAIEVTVPSDAYTADRLVEVFGARLKRTARKISDG